MQPEIETASLVKKYESRGGKYRFELFRDSRGFTFAEYQSGRPAGGGGYGTKTEAEVMEHVTRYLRTFPSTMREVTL